MINDNDLTDKLLPRIHKLNLDPVRRNKTAVSPASSPSRSRSKSPSKIRAFLTRRTTDTKEKKSSLPKNANGHKKANNASTSNRKPREKVINENKAKVPADPVKHSGREQEQVGKVIESVKLPPQLPQPQPTYSEVMRDYAQALDLSEYERECLGFFDDNTEFSAAGISDEVEPMILKQQITNLKTIPETDVHEISVNTDAEGVEIPKTAGCATQTKPSLPSEVSFREHAQDMSSDWEEDIKEISKQEQEDDEDEMFLKNLLKSTSFKDRMIAAFVETRNSNNNNMIRQWSDMKGHRDNQAQLVDNNKKANSCIDSPRTNHNNTNNSNLATLPSHDLLSVAIYALLDDYVCDRNHKEGDVNCFVCQHKEGFKSLAGTYLGEMKYIWESSDKFSPVTRYEKIFEILEVWIYQLSEQNLALGKAYDAAVEESEKVRNFLLQSRNTFRTQQWQHDIDRAKIDALSYELSLRDKTIEKLQSQLNVQSEEAREMAVQLEEAQADVNSLTALIIRLRDHGVWDVHGLPISDRSMMKISNEDYYLHGAKVIGHREYSQKKKEWRNEIDKLKTEMETLRSIIGKKDNEIHRFKQYKFSTTATIDD